MIYLLIASEGSYEDKETWIVEVFMNAAVALEEAARLNVASQKAHILYNDYMERREELRSDMAKSVLAEEGRSASAELRFFHLSGDKRRAVDARIDAQIGPEPDGYEEIDHTVVAVPIGERGKWELP